MNKHLFLNKLTSKYPSVLEKYNYDLLPDEFSSNDKIPVECYRHGIFRIRATQHLCTLQGCSKCGYEATGRASAARVVVSNDEFIRRSRVKFGSKFSYAKTEYTRKEAELTVTCPAHGDVRIRACAHLWSKYGCPKCEVEVPRAIQRNKYLEKAKEVHGDRYDYSKIVLSGFNRKVEIVCKVHGSFYTNLFQHVRRVNGCPKCAKDSEKLLFDEFIKKARKVHGDLYDYDKGSYVSANFPVKVYCRVHGWFAQRASSHLAGCGCKECLTDRHRRTAAEFIEAAKKVHGDKYDYSRVRYRNSKQKVELICSIHGPFWVKPNSHVSSGSGCRLCSESSGERAVARTLEGLGIEYVREYKIRPHPYRYDFYIPILNVFVEYNGQQHYQPIEMFGGQPALEVVRKNDEIKKVLVSQVKGKLITIPFTFAKPESIEAELKRQLKKLCRYWVLVDGKIELFRTKLDLCLYFGILDIKLTDEELVSIIGLTDPDCRVIL